MLEKKIEVANKTITIQTGKLAKQAAGAVVVKSGDSTVLVTVTYSKEKREGIDFFPLLVEYREMTYAAGKIPGGFFKREGRLSTHEILISRMIDRPLRPLFPKNFFNDVQICAIVLSSENDFDTSILAMNGASAALAISPLPVKKTLGSVKVAFKDGNYIINPTEEELEQSELDLVVSGTDDAVTMIEGEAKEISADILVNGVEAAHEEIKKIIAGIKEFANEQNVEKIDIIPEKLDDDIINEIQEYLNPFLDELNNIHDKTDRSIRTKEIINEYIDKFAEKVDEEKQWLLKSVFEKFETESVRKFILAGKRPDGRQNDELRHIECEVGFLPRVHGSALFTRGQTQSLGTVTLGTDYDKQTIDDIRGDYSKNLMLHYNFPAFSVGEVRPNRGPGRREIGHGNLAERALKQVLPDELNFPYAIRIVSEILESNGSSSMASVCSGSLALMDAGVKTTGHVAGIAMGLIYDETNPIILTDIQGVEDHYGDMDLKVASTAKGITSVQMDLKVAGISMDILRSGINQALEAVNRILTVMNSTIPEPRSQLSEYAPQIISIQIPKDKIGLVIGPGGKNIRGIMEKTETEISIEDDGITQISGVGETKVQEAANIIKNMVRDPEVGDKIVGIVKSIKPFGAFVEIKPGVDGLLHISEIDNKRTERVEDVLSEGDTVEVVIKGIDGQRISLSRKALL